MKNRQQPRLTPYVVKAAHQPLDTIVLQIKKGVDFQESMLVRMHKTTPFIQLKDKLRKKDEKDSELVVRTPGGDSPVFDNETPSSVSRIQSVLIVVVEGVQNANVFFFCSIKRLACSTYLRWSGDLCRICRDYWI
jgi:hypothetical protein